jgi:TolB-like protein/Tfp pilus assembly protein PilF
MLHTFLAELKRRNVLRVVGAYAVVAWGALQVAEKLFPALTLPPWTVTFVAALLLIGLPITAVLAWAFEITPEGVRRTTDDASAPQRAGWVEAALLLAIVAAVGVTIVQLTHRSAARNDAEDAATGAESASVRADPATANSIAVLPFTSFSDDADSNYFADGLTEELINDLAHIGGLKVSGRTSAFYFKNRNEDLREIGRKLGVAQVLEGSVRRAGDKLRITVQLISTADGFHLWSQTYDRQMADIFAIQDDVAQNVAGVLEMKIAPRHTAAKPDSADYQRYLIAVALLHERTRDSLTQAREIFTDLKAHDPTNVDAAAGYTQATMLLAGAYLAFDFDPAARDAIETVERALAIDPQSVNANVAAGAAYTVLLHRTDERRYRDVAERALARAVELAPDDPDALAAYGTLLNEIGRYDDAYDAMRRAVSRDPLSRVAQAQLITALEGLGRFAEARERLVTLGQMYPDYVFAPLELGELLLAQGQLDAALPYLRKAHATKTSPRATFALANAYLNLGLDDDVRATLKEGDYAPIAAFGDAIVANMRGDDAATLRLAQSQLEKTNDPIWRSILINSALSLNDLATARRAVIETDPTLLTSLDATRVPAESALFAGDLLMREGKTDDATKLLDSLLAAQAPPKNGFDPVARKVLRAKALARLGRDDAAIAELRAAQLQGNRMLWDFDFFQRIDRAPAFVTLRNDQRFRTIVAEIEADNRAMRERVLNSEEG